MTVAVPRWVTAANQKSKPEVVARLTKMLLDTPAEGFCGWGGAISTLDITDRLKTITLPTNVIVGAEDPGTPPAAAEAIHREIKGSNLVVVPNTSHMLCAEEPAVFNKHVLDFLGQARLTRRARVKRALVLGGYGAFGRRVAERLARVPGHRGGRRRARPGEGRGLRGGAGRAGEGARYPRGAWTVRQSALLTSRS